MRTDRTDYSLWLLLYAQCTNTNKLLITRQMIGHRTCGSHKHDNRKIFRVLIHTSSRLNSIIYGSNRTSTDNLQVFEAFITIKHMTYMVDSIHMWESEYRLWNSPRPRDKFFEYTFAMRNVADKEILCIYNTHLRLCVSTLWRTKLNFYYFTQMHRLMNSIIESHILRWFNENA